jgi:hypothetical protein
MRFLDAAVLLSSLSFLAYAVGYFNSPRLAQEFVRFGLPKLGPVVALFQAAGAIGLLAGYRYPLLTTLASAGLALMMLVALLVRLRVGDSLWVSLPALFFLGLNLAICVISMNRPNG